MKLQTISILMIIVFIVISIGFLTLGSMGHQACPISKIFGLSCPPLNDLLALANHHLSGLQSFTQATFNSDIGLILFFSIFLSVAFLFLKTGQLSKIKPPLSWVYLFIRRLNFSPNNKFIKWLSLHNKINPRVLF
ncbi:hypothetical protein A2995_01365 [Candidatus Nomurabacteria bacterium RIFCSPLOWO2_01_FULL_33_24]|uniref:Uncharacterized protein n=1 Tax=Candidatus Nomurabacteria bacterium RIFCSPLOWO2_01_FULL_33_24 TaxID=1801765 RepID=A0A1F6X0N1_9BACT|nr:MAG: hypothetical protein A2995_01365 [Candidatus Nomurabacteria bacterium RIFCSPLOWO2_01_FULL_33_24]